MTAFSTLISAIGCRNQYLFIETRFMRCYSLLILNNFFGCYLPSNSISTQAQKHSIMNTFLAYLALSHKRGISLEPD